MKITITNGQVLANLFQIITQNSLEAKHLILVRIMKVKGPKNQADFIEVLYVVVNALGASF